jgi:hypothetical protein
MSALLVRVMTGLLLLTSSLCFSYEVDSAEMKRLEAKMPALNSGVFELAVHAYNKARSKGMDDRGILTIVDYTLPSSDKRLWVVDLNQEEILSHTYVTHGRGTGALFAKHFSNENNSHESSVGLFLTGDAYHGHVGYALRLHGLEHGYNDNAESRAIVVHGAVYANPSFIRKYGRLGRSLGCFALPEANYKRIISLIKNGTLIFSYYPVPSWLTHSRYLAD